jgi:hypothetical protein
VPFEQKWWLMQYLSCIIKLIYLQIGFTIKAISEEQTVNGEKYYTKNEVKSFHHSGCNLLQPFNRQ